MAGIISNPFFLLLSIELFTRDRSTCYLWQPLTTLNHLEFFFVEHAKKLILGVWF